MKRLPTIQEEIIIEKNINKIELVFQKNNLDKIIIGKSFFRNEKIIVESSNFTIFNYLKYYNKKHIIISEIETV